MTQEEKDLLLKDLCARIPFKVKVEAKGLHKTIEDDYNNRNIIAHVLIGLNLRDSFKTYSIDYSDKIPLFNIRNGDCNIKPYLFPLSSMTDEQEEEYNNLNCWELGCFPHTEDALDYLIANQFDYRGLIEMGLALDATGLGIYDNIK